MIAVDDGEISAAIGEMARMTGVFAEPAAAAGWAGLGAARRADLIADDETVALLVTGTGLKDVAAAAAGLEPIRPVPPTLDGLTAALRDSVEGA